MNIFKKLFKHITSESKQIPIKQEPIRYLNDLVDYIRLKEGNSFLLNLKSINKDVKHKKRVFNKGNAEIIKEIDNFYSDKQMAKSK